MEGIRFASPFRIALTQLSQSCLINYSRFTAWSLKRFRKKSVFGVYANLERRELRSRIMTFEDVKTDFKLYIKFASGFILLEEKPGDRVIH